MPVKKPPRIPKLRTHKATGQGYVVLNGQAIYLGRASLPETERRYHQVIAEWLANDRQSRVAPEQFTVKEFIARYWLYAQKDSRDLEGNVSRERKNIRDAVRPVRERLAMMPAAKFGPRALRTVRQKMIDAGPCRRNINCRIGRIKRVFRWAASEELIPGEVYHALLSVEDLRRGRCEANECQPVRPVPDAHVGGIKPLVSRQVWAIIELQRSTGARPGEIAIIRPIDGGAV